MEKNSSVQERNSVAQTKNGIFMEKNNTVQERNSVAQTRNGIFIEKNGTITKNSIPQEKTPSKRSKRSSVVS